MPLQLASNKQHPTFFPRWIATVPTITGKTSSVLGRRTAMLWLHPAKHFNCCCSCCCCLSCLAAYTTVLQLITLLIPIQYYRERSGVGGCCSHRFGCCRSRCRGMADPLLSSEYTYTFLPAKPVSRASHRLSECAQLSVLFEQGNRWFRFES